MARGRTLFSEHSRRAASVPVEHLSFPDTTTASRLHNIRSHVFDDTDAMTAASRRHDRDFLHRVQSTLANSSSFVKAPPTLNHNRARGPPPCRSAYYATAAAPSSAPSYALSSAPRDLRRRTWYGPTSNRVDDYEVAAYLATPIRPPFVSRAVRAGSVPPSVATVPRWYPGGHVRGSQVPRWAPSTYRTYGSGRDFLRTHPDMEDIVIGVAPTTQYGDIVIGIPYRKQFMFDVQHGIDAIEDYPRIPAAASRVKSPYFAHHNVDVTPYQYSGSRYSYPRYGTRSSVTWYPSYSQPPVASSYAAPARRFSTIGGYPYRAPPITEYDLDLYGSKTPKDSFSNLRPRISLARDRYSPTELLTRGSVISSSLGTSLDFGGRGGTPHASLPGSYSFPAPLPPTGTVPSKPFAPQISETRQRVRELLCKTKNDPGYFD